MTKSKHSSVLCGIALISLASTVSAGRIALFKRDDQPVVAPKTVNVPLSFGANGNYMMPVDMATGDATQNFNFTLSLGTGLTFVTGQSCDSCGDAKGYNQGVSTTAKALDASVNSTFPGSVASGAIIKETCALKLSNGSNWNYPNQTIVVVDKQTTSNGLSGLFSSGISGIVGLGTNTRNNNATDAVSGALSSAGLQDSIYGQWFIRNPLQSNFSFGMALQGPTFTPKDTSGASAPAPSSAGVIHWLQPDTSAYKTNQVVFKPVNNAASSTSGAAANNNQPGNGDWSLSFDGWSFSSGTLQIKNSQPVVGEVDALYNQIYMPMQAAKQINDAISGSQANQSLSSLGSLSQAWSIPCNSQFTLGFIVGPQTFNVDPKFMIVQQSDGTCTSAVEGWNDSSNSQYLLGASFISSIYLIFNIARDGSQTVGFAPRSEESHKVAVGAIVGGTIGGVAGVVILGLVAFFIIRHYHDKSRLNTLGGIYDPHAEDHEAKPQVVPYTVGAPSEAPSSPTTAFSNGGTVFSIQQQQGFQPTSPAATDPLLSDIVTSDHSQYDEPAPPTYDASEQARMHANPNAGPRQPIREKGGHLSQISNGSNGAGPSS